LYSAIFFTKLVLNKPENRLIMPKLIAVLPFALLLNTTAMAAAVTEKTPEIYGDITVNNVTEVYDGDSFKVNINSWPKIIGKEVIIRIKGIDAPEMKGKCEKESLMAKLARQHTVNLINNAFRVDLKNIQRDQYFRILADVYVDRINLGDSLVAQKFAVRYAGGKKYNWCD